MRIPYTTIALSLALGGLIGSAPAQEPTEITYGETASNFLTTTDDSLQDGSRFKLYYFRGNAGDSITIYMSSTEFNVSLLFADSEDSVLVTDDNGGGDCNAHLSAVLEADGLYAIYANASSAGEIGQYQLTLMRGSHPPQGQAQCSGFLAPEGILAVGDSVEGSLDEGDRVLSNGSFFEVWTLTRTPGRTFTADIQSSEFDARLILVRGFSSAGVIALDDDSGGGCNARTTHTAQDRSVLRLVVIAAGARKPGSYRLIVTEGTKPPAAESQCQIQSGDGRPDGA